MIDAYASQPHYWHHIAPIWQQLTDDERGTVYLHPSVLSDTPHTKAAQPPPARRPILIAAAPDLSKTGDRPVVFVEHGAGQTYNTPHPSYAGGPDRDKVRLFLCPNDRVRDANARAYPVPAEVVGSPRLEWLAGLEGTGEHLAVTWHWNCDLVPETRSAFPRYRKALPELAGALGHAHPRIWGACQPAYKQAGIYPIQEWADVLREGIGCLVADNTSVMWEAAALNIPVAVVNLNTYRRDVEHGLRFWEYANVGPHINHPSELGEVAKSWREWAGVYDRRRREVAGLLYGNIPGSAWRAAEAIRSHGMT